MQTQCVFRLKISVYQSSINADQRFPVIPSGTGRPSNCSSVGAKSLSHHAATRRTVLSRECRAWGSLCAQWEAAHAPPRHFLAVAVVWWRDMTSADRDQSQRGAASPRGLRVAASITHHARPYQLNEIIARHIAFRASDTSSATCLRSSPAVSHRLRPWARRDQCAVFSGFGASAWAEERYVRIFLVSDITGSTTADTRQVLSSGYGR